MFGRCILERNLINPIWGTASLNWAAARQSKSRGINTRQFAGWKKRKVYKWKNTQTQLLHLNCSPPPPGTWGRAGLSAALRDIILTVSSQCLQGSAVAACLIACHCQHTERFCRVHPPRAPPRDGWARPNVILGKGRPNVTPSSAVLIYLGDPKSAGHGRGITYITEWEDKDIDVPLWFRALFL